MYKFNLLDLLALAELAFATYIAVAGPEDKVPVPEDGVLLARGSVSCRTCNK